MDVKSLEAAAYRTIRNEHRLRLDCESGKEGFFDFADGVISFCEDLKCDLPSRNEKKEK